MNDFPKGGILLMALLLSAGCVTRHLEPADPDILALSEAGAAAYAAGLPSKAAVLYSQALERGRLLDVPREVARNAYNLGLCRMAAGEWMEARRWLDQARVLLEPDGEELGRVLVACAETATRMGDICEAVTLAERVPLVCKETAVRCQALVLLAEIHAGEAKWDAVRERYVAARRMCKGTEIPPGLSARQEGLAARLIGAGVLKGDRAACLLRKAELLRKAGSYREMAESLGEAGDAFSASGRKADAFTCYERSAHSLDAGGQRVAADVMVGRMRSLAGDLKDSTYIERLALAERILAADKTKGGTP